MNIGDIYRTEYTVREEDTADKIGSGGLPVYSTPSMISLMEKTAYELAAEGGHQTVGTKVNISHLKACRTGTAMTSVAELVEIDGRRLTFKVSVSCPEGLVGEGTHERFIIDPERFMAKLG